MFHGIFISPRPLILTDYSDANWVGNPLNRRSTIGFCLFLGSTLINRKVFKHKTVYRSSIESEYHALATIALDVIWLDVYYKILEFCLQNLHLYIVIINLR